MRNQYKVLLEVYDKNINPLFEQEEKTGDVTPDGESTLKIDKYGTKRWLNKDGEYHNRFGPAYEGKKGYKAWFINGKHHREDGPARTWPAGHAVCPNGREEYYLDHKLYSYEDWKKEVDRRQRARLTKDIYKKGSEETGLDLTNLSEKKEKTGDMTPDGESTLKIDEYGTKRWLNKDGEYHNRFGPAYEGKKGYKAWFISGKRHREDGPAIIWSSGEKEYYLDSKLYSYENWLKEVEHRKNLRDIYKKGSKDSGLDLTNLNEQEEKTGDMTPDGESTLKIDEYGTKIWINKNDEFHNRFGPAYEEKSGYKVWYINGKYHREDGPAIIWPRGGEEYYLDGKRYSYEDWKKEAEHRKNLRDIYKKGSEDSGLDLTNL